ncbi:hypothetical protein V7138_09725, partial [Bacillus sp. JJ1533]|uniref:hypothetical protein n=1 Tax=Bacillus sp. JJ1533 TaxID=3122959 RepID=UPI002FFE4594
MYENYQRNKAIPYGFSWPYYEQPTYPPFNGGGYQSGWNQSYPPFYMQYNMNSYPGYSSSGYQTPYPTPYP